jgi:arabinofuranan 3-O-arabinosyltransferase
LSWDEPQEITGLHLNTDKDSGASRPTDLLITVPQGNQSVPVTPEGDADFTLTTKTIQISVLATDTKPGRPAGITDLAIAGVDFPRLAQDTPFTVPCGKGPELELDGFRYTTSVSGTLADYIAHRPLEFTTCRDLEGGVDLEAGDHEISTAPSDAFVVQDLRLLSTSDEPAVEPRGHTVTQFDVTHREIQVEPGEEAVLSVPENANDGWVATLDGEELRRVRVDGWQQAWLVPAGEGGTVLLDFAPDGQYRTRLMVGGLAALLLVGSVLLPVRRRRPIDVRPGARRWLPFVLIGILALLGGMLPLVLLIACLLLRTLWAPAPRALAFGGAAFACVVAVTGRLLDHGQSWAYGWLAQASLLLAMAAVVSSCVDWFDSPRANLDDRAGEDEQARRDGRGGDHLSEFIVEPRRHQDDLDHYGEPEQHR